MTTHGPGKNKARINLAVHEEDAKKIKIRAESSGLSINGYINALLSDAINNAAIVQKNTSILREKRGSYVVSKPATDNIDV
jgi:hypothetical protein